MLNRLPPYSGIRLSSTVTSAPSSTRRCARLDPMKPTPPVINTLAFLKESWGIVRLRSRLSELPDD